MSCPANVLDAGITQSAVHTLAEITLALVLFADAARIDVRLLARDHDIPLRMLVIGMPLAILFGTVAAWSMPLGLGLAEAALLAAVLAPTDAALGQAVVASKIVLRAGSTTESPYRSCFFLRRSSPSMP